MLTFACAFLQATQRLLDELPSYVDLTSSASPARPDRTVKDERFQAETQRELWMHDSILATRVQFLMNVLGPCLPALAQVRHIACRSQPQNGNPRHYSLIASCLGKGKVKSTGSRLGP